MKINPFQDNACVGDVIRCCLRGVRLSGMLGLVVYYIADYVWLPARC